MRTILKNYTLVDEKGLRNLSPCMWLMEVIHIGLKIHYV